MDHDEKQLKTDEVMFVGWVIFLTLVIVALLVWGYFTGQI